MLADLWYRLRTLIRRDRADADLDEELKAHLAHRIARLEREGLSHTHARRLARLELGGVEQVKEHCRDARGTGLAQDVLADVRFAARLLRKDPQFTVASVLALGLALGSVATAFTFVNGAVLQGLPLAHADQLVWMRTVDAQRRPLGVSYADVRDWRDASRLLSHVVVSFEFPINISEDERGPQRFNGSFVSHQVFDMLGQAPLLGRSFRADDDQADAPRVALLARRVWERRYASDPSILGRVIRVNDMPTTIVGVMPDRVHFPFATEVWVPVAHAAGTDARQAETRGTRNVLVVAIGRLGPDVGRPRAQAELDAITTRLAERFPATNTGISVELAPIAEFYWGPEQLLPRLMVVVFGMAAAVLIIACANLGNLLLARGVYRAGELGIRAALGASRGRIIRQLMAESVLLVALGGVVGLVLAHYGTDWFGRALTRAGDGPPPFWMQFAIDWRARLFLGATAIGTGLLLGLPSAWYLVRRAPDRLRESGRALTGGVRRRRWASALIVIQLSLSLVLLAGAGLLVRSFWTVYTTGRVLESDGLLTMQLALGAGKYGGAPRIKALFQALDERLTAEPAFTAVTVASDVPMLTRINGRRQLTIEADLVDPPRQPPIVNYLYVGPRYFETLRLRLRRGRIFTEADGLPGQEAVIVNQRFVDLYFADRDPLGQRVQLVNAAAPSAPRPWFTIIGVAPTVPQILFNKTLEPVAYASIRGEPGPHLFVSIIARTAGDRASAVAALRRAVHAVDPDLPGYNVQTMEEIQGLARWPLRVFASVVGLLAVIALVVAIVGLYAVTAHAVTQRTREIGIRTALGATARHTVWLVSRGTVGPLGVGLGLGLIGAWYVGRALDPLLIRTDPADPYTLVGVSLALSVVAVGASVWSGRRAASMSPMRALRCE